MDSQVYLFKCNWIILKEYVLLCNGVISQAVNSILRKYAQSFDVSLTFTKSIDIFQVWVFCDVLMHNYRKKASYINVRNLYDIFKVFAYFWTHKNLYIDYSFGPLRQEYIVNNLAYMELYKEDYVGLYETCT